MKVAVFGCGYWAAFQVAAWQALGAQVVAVWNRTGERAKAFAQKWNIPCVFERAEDAFTWGQFDVADIIADVGAHEELVKMAAAHKKPVICQKPMGDTLASCEEMANACRQAGVWFAVHENFRYQPPTVAFIDAVRSGAIGKLLHAQLNMRSPDLAIIEKQPALRGMPHMALRDMGPHIFDVARAAFGEMQTMYALPVISYAEAGISVPDAAICTMKAQSGAAISCHLVHKWNDRFVAQGDRGRVVLDHDNVLHIETDGDRQVIDTKNWAILPYIPREDWDLHGGHIMSAIPRCLADLMAAYESGKAAPTSGADNLRTMRLVFAAIESCETGAVVTL